MGGHTFGVEARRLTTQQHAALFAHVRTKLGPFTPFGLRTTISPDDKVSHGDLDVMIGSWAEGPGFKYQFAGQAEEFDIHSLTPSKVWCEITGTRGSQWLEDDLRNRIRDVARAIGAIVWQKHRIGAIFAVPCSVLGDLTADADDVECFQVDLNIVRPDRLDFGEFILSYDITPLFVNQFLKQLSPAFKVHHEHLALRHSPYPGEPAIEIEWINDPQVLLSWLGLDYDRWKNGFATQHEYQIWLAGIPDWGGVVPRIGDDEMEKPVVMGWKKLLHQTGPIKDTAGHQKERIVRLEGFLDWLGMIRYGWEDLGAVTSTATVTPLPARMSVTKRYIISTTTKITLRIDHETHEAVQESVDTETTTSEVSNTQAESDTPASEQWSDEPIPLDKYATKALDHFGQREVYERVLEVMKKAMKVKNENRRRKKQNRDFAQIHDSKASRDDKKALGKWA